jgi:hypothetical protein
VAAAEGEAKAARDALADTSDRAGLPQSNSSANAAVLEEVAHLRETNAELQSRASYLEEQLIQRDRLLESMPEHSLQQATPQKSTGAVPTCALSIICTSNIVCG